MPEKHMLDENGRYKLGSNSNADTAATEENTFTIHIQNGTSNGAKTEAADSQSSNTQNELGNRVNDHSADSARINNGTSKLLKRLETVPDIKRDTSGITKQYIGAGIVNLGALAIGECIAWSSPVLPRLLEPSIINNGTHAKIVITENEGSWIASLVCLGAFFGAVPAGLISEYFGRKKTLLYLALPLVVSWILVASSPNVYGMYVGRFVSGVAVGAFSVAIPPYISDIAEEELEPTLANFYHVLFSGGVLLGYVIGLVKVPSWMSVLCAVVPVVYFIAFIFLPESPTYLLTQGKQSEALAALRYYRGIDNNIEAEIKSIKEHIRNCARNKVTFKELYTNVSTRKALIVSFGLIIAQQLSGIYPILLYSETINKELKVSLSASAASIIIAFCLCSSTYFSTMLLRTVRRRTLLMFSFISMAITIGALAVYYQVKAPNLSEHATWGVLLALCLYVILYAVGVGPIPWLILREIFPSNAIRRATAITVGVHWLLAFGVTKLFQNVESHVRLGWTLCNFAVISILGAFFVYFFVPETKGRTLKEIQNEFEGISRKRRHKHVIEIESVSEA